MSGTWLLRCICAPGGVICTTTSICSIPQGQSVDSPFIETVRRSASQTSKSPPFNSLPRTLSPDYECSCNVCAVSPAVSDSSDHSGMPLDDNANANPFFSNSVIRAFLFGNSDSLSQEIPSLGTTKVNCPKGSSMQRGSKASHSLIQQDSHCLVLDPYNPLEETCVDDSPLALSPAIDDAPLASYDEDEDLFIFSVSCLAGL